MESFCNGVISNQTGSKCNLKCKKVFRLPNVKDIPTLVSPDSPCTLASVYLVYAVQARVLG
jgi:hypothetical protein